MVETLSITVTIPMVRKAAMCAYRTEGPLPSLYKDFSVFVEMASYGSRETKHTMTSASFQTGACTRIDHRVRSIQNALQTKH
jgi:hypothetical protein